MSFLEIGASLLGGLIGSSSASDAADAQAAGSAAATAEQRRQFDLTRQDYAPYRETGTNALAMLARYMGLPAASLNNKTLEQIKAELSPTYTTPGTPAGYGPVTSGITYGPEGNNQNMVWQPGTPGSVNQQGLDAAAQAQFQGQPTDANLGPLESIDPLQDPGYQFGLDQGNQALDRKIAASGGRVSGAAIKAGTRFATDYATTGYGAAYQRGQDRLNRLAALANVGQTATSGSAQAGANASNAISSIYQNQGDNAGAASIAQGNIWGNAINQGVAAYQRNKQPAYTSSPADLNFGSATQNWW